MSKLWFNKFTKKPTMLIIVILIAALGSYLVINSYAETPFSSVLADSGKLTSPATKETCSGTYDGDCVTFGSLPVVSTPVGSPVTLSAPPGEQTALVADGDYGLKLNEWNSSEPIVMTSDGGSDFNIPSSNMSLATGGAPSGYYEMWKGSSWGANTNNKGAPFPFLVSSITPGMITTSATCHTAGVSGDWDNSYDIWFNASSTAGQTNNQAAPELEMMIWLNHTSGADPIGHQVASNVAIGGNTYNIWYNDSGGNTVSYVLSNPSTTISTDLYPMIQNSISRGYMPSSYYLLDVEFGFEIWNGGSGLGCSNFTVNAE
jgi:hypothetical protein